MPDLKTLIGELEGLRGQAQQLLEAHKDGLTAEARQQIDALRQQMQAKTVEIETTRADLERKADLQKVTDFLQKPEYKVPHGAEQGSDPRDFRKAIESAGWEFKNGIALAPTSLGTKVEMFGEEVLFGPIPTDDFESAAYFKTMRAAFSPIYRQAYVKWMRAACKTRSESMAFTTLEPEEQKALSEGSDTAGGFLVPPDVQAEMLVRLPQMAVMRKYARVVTTSRDVLRYPLVQAHATSGSIYSSGFVGTWAGETPAFSDTDAAFGMFDVAIKKARVATKLSNDFVADAAVNVLAFLAQNGAENMALVEDNGFIAGDGTALQPRGLLNSGITTVDVEGSTTDTISNSTSSTGSAPKIIDLCYALPSQYLPRARWLMRRSIEGKVRKLVDAQGRFLWPALSGSGFAAAPRDLMGYPIDNTEFMEADGANGRKVVVFGDLSAYVIAQRAQISTVLLRERFADTDQVGIILFERVGGAVWNPDALRIGIV